MLSCDRGALTAARARRKKVLVRRRSDARAVLRSGRPGFSRRSLKASTEVPLPELSIFSAGLLTFFLGAIIPKGAAMRRTGSTDGMKMSRFAHLYTAGGTFDISSLHLTQYRSKLKVKPRPGRQAAIELTTLCFGGRSSTFRSCLIRSNLISSYLITSRPSPPSSYQRLRPPPPASTTQRHPFHPPRRIP